MRKLTLTTLTCLMTFVSAFASTTFPIHLKLLENRSENLTVAPISSLTDNDISEIMQGQYPDTAVEFAEKTTLPISLFLTGDLVNIVGTQGKFGMVEIQQTFYIRCVEQDLIFSTNLTEWKPFLEFITGEVSVVLTVQYGKASIVVGARGDHRI